MKSKSALVGADRAVELNSEASVYLRLAVVVNPGNSEVDNSLGLNESLDKSDFLVLGMSLNNRLEGLKNFLYRLQELGLVSVALLNLLKYRL